MTLHETPKQAAKRLAAGAIRDGYMPEALHAYTAVDGKALYWRIRAKNPQTGEKWIRPMKVNGEGFTLGEPVFPDGKPLYRLPDLTVRVSDTVVITEGEWCADALGKLGILTTTSGAADSAVNTDWQPLAHRPVLIWPDHDDAGSRYAETVKEKLKGLDCAVSVIDVAKLELPPKGDAVDWLAKHADAAPADVLALPCVREDQGEAADAEPLAGLVCAASIVPQPIDWLWNGWLAAGKLHILAGAPGCGKTTLALALASTITMGGQWPDGTHATRGDVLMWSSEDDATDVLVPRLIGMGADCGRVHFIQTAVEGDERRAFDPATDIAQLRSAIKHMGMSPRTLIVDPIVSAVAGDSHKGSETRRSLQPLVDLGAEFGCAVLGISHFSKGTQGRETIERVTGSLAFGALARLVFAAAKMSDDQGGGRFIARAKSNIGPDGGGYLYELRQEPLPNHPGIVASSVLWGAPIAGSAREILAKAEAVEDPETRTQTSEAEDWLADLLANGPVKANEAIKKAKIAGHSDKSLRTARERLRVRPKKSNFSGGWTWGLPDYQDAQQGEDAQHARTQSMGSLGAFDETQRHLGTGNGKKPPNGEDF
jgi:putative DNA primase/helicase